MFPTKPSGTNRCPIHDAQARNAMAVKAAKIVLNMSPAVKGANVMIR